LRERRHRRQRGERSRGRQSAINHVHYSLKASGSSTRISCGSGASLSDCPMKKTNKPITATAAAPYAAYFSCGGVRLENEERRRLRRNISRLAPAVASGRDCPQNVAKF
jgi:hypothetical protein